jgi:hypothetical protein
MAATLEEGNAKGEIGEVLEEREKGREKGGREDMPSPR